MKWWKRISIKRKLIAVYLPLIILPVVCLSIASYALFTYKVEQASRMLAEQTAEQITRHLETYLEELERLSLFPYFHRNVMDILLRDVPDAVSPNELYQEYQLFNDMFNNIMLNPRKDLFNVFLYREDGTRYFNSRVNVTLNGDYDWKASDWYRKTRQAEGDVVYTADAGQDGRFSLLPYEIFSISRLIKSEDGEVLGVILIDANFEGVEEILRDIGLGAEANVILKDEENQILYAQNTSYLNDLKNIDTDTANKLHAEARTLFIGNDQSSMTGWKATVIIPSSEIYDSFISLRGILIWLSAVFGIITLIATYWISESMTRPIRTMHQMMRKVEHGNYDVELEPVTQDEIGNLGHAFNKMSARIKELIHEVYEFNLRQKDAELNNLKMQIRPHFLYNTLEAIRSLAELSDNRDVADMSGSLGSILRYSIKNHQRLVLLDKEVEYMRQYLNIHRIMIGDSIRIEIDIHAAILRYYSIPLLFQPIIENALQHGLYGKRSGGLLRIVGARTGDQLHFSIIDNGNGIAAEHMEAINRELHNPIIAVPHDPGRGIGLHNVNQRIKIVFGDEYGLQLEPYPNGGTIVHIRIPVVTEQLQDNQKGR